jgi:outer membrane protein assembly factor BamD (BamD/ComL family)
MTAARNHLALAHAVAGDMTAARTAFEAAGDPAQALYNTGLVDLAQGHFMRAATSFEAAHSARPTMPIAAERARQAFALARAAGSEK